MSEPVHYHLGKFPPQSIHWEKLIPLIGPANGAIASFNAILKAIPNASVLLTPMTTQEAVLSSRIEGTQATMGEVLEFEAGMGKGAISSERKDDIYEIINYRRAMRHAIEMMESLPLCLRIIRKTHEVLLSDVRGGNKAPGKFRKSLNWIGAPGCPIERANFIPISPELLPGALSVWEAYVNQQTLDAIVQLAVLHAEFEALHPFLDGNGRLGRILIPLFLYQKKLLSQPIFYMSAYLESNRNEYCEKLRNISRDDDWTDWCEFFLRGFIYQAEENHKKASMILELYSNQKNLVTELTHSQHAIKAIDFVFTRPIFASSDFIQQADIPAPSAKRILQLLAKNNVVKTLSPGRGSRPARFVFSELLNIVEGENLF
ncbi:MAG: Fic family protein [bacterium]|nr:Fic family protein [bacterium]